MLPDCPSVEHLIVLTDEGHMVPIKTKAGVHAYESLIAGHSAEAKWGDFDENTAAGLCYTSGTTGNPKGVLYSHRTNFLHTLTGLAPDVLDLSIREVILPVVPLFHANAWGLAFDCPAIGAKLVMPGQKLDGASIYELMESEGVTFSAGVPTVWQMLLQHVEQPQVLDLEAAGRGRFSPSGVAPARLPGPLRHRDHGRLGDDRDLAARHHVQADARTGGPAL